MIAVVLSLIVAGCFGLVAYAYAGYEICLRLLARRRQRNVRRFPIRPDVSVIVAVHNGESCIAQKLSNLLAQNYPASRIEILVADDASTDGTAAEVTRAAARFGVRVVRLERRAGKEAAQIRAVRIARGEILVLTDVTTTMDPQAVERLVENFADPKVGCVSSIDAAATPSDTGSEEQRYVGHEMRIRLLESRVGSLVGVSGSLFAVRRPIAEQLVSDLPSDFYSALIARRLGFRTVIDERVRGVYCQSVSVHGEFRRKVRTVLRGITTLLANRDLLDPRRHGLFAWQLASHKLCRWLVPFALILSLLASIGLAATSPASWPILAGQLLGYAAGSATLLAQSRPLPAPLRLTRYLVVVNAAILAACWKYARGRRITYWAPTRRPEDRRPEDRRPESASESTT